MVLHVRVKKKKEQRSLQQLRGERGQGRESAGDDHDLRDVDLVVERDAGAEREVIEEIEERIENETPGVSDNLRWDDTQQSDPFCDMVRSCLLIIFQ